jgi:type I restriction enzyme, S subunit
MNDARVSAGRLLALYDRISAAPDAVARMRRFVLDLAMRGKLVEQDPTDEPASDLLMQIATEKAASGKRQKDLPEIDEGKLGIFPSTWTAVPLIALGEWAIGSGFPKNEQGQTDGPYFFLKVSDMNLPENEKYITTANNLIDDDAAKRMRAAIHPPGTIIFPKIGGAIATNKRRILTRGSAIDNNCLGITFSSHINTEWAYLLMTTLDFTHYQAGTAVPALQQGTLAAIPVALPPLAEQQRIVAKVDELMELCDRLEEKRTNREALRDRLTAASLARLTAPNADGAEGKSHARFALDNLPALTARPDQIKPLRQTILNLAVRGKLVEQDPSDGSGENLLRQILALPWKKKRNAKDLEPDEAAMASAFPLPENWAWATVQALARPNETITYGILKPEWVDEGVPTVRVTEMKTGEVDVAALPRCRSERAAKFAKTTLAPGDLLVSKDGTIGKTAFVPPELAGGNITQHVLRFPICELVDRHFIRLAIDAPFCQSWMDGETKGVALQGVNVGDFRRMPIPLPPLAEQHRIVAKVDELIALCDQLEANLSTADTTRRRLLEALLHEALAPAAGTQEAAE